MKRITIFSLCAFLFYFVQINLTVLTLNREAGSNAKYFRIVKENRTHTCCIAGKLPNIAIDIFLKHVQLINNTKATKYFITKKSNILYSLGSHLVCAPTTLLGRTLTGQNFYLTRISKLETNKKVLLRERKRHTARRVASTPSQVWGGGEVPCPRSGLGGYLIPGLDRG